MIVSQRLILTEESGAIQNISAVPRSGMQCCVRKCEAPSSFCYRIVAEKFRVVEATGQARLPSGGLAIVVNGYKISLRWCDLDYLTFLEYASNCKLNAAIARVSRYAILTKTFWLAAGVSCCRIERSAPFARSAASHYRVLQSFRYLRRQ
jgi:hypothetical protein